MPPSPPPARQSAPVIHKGKLVILDSNGRVWRCLGPAKEFT